MGLLDAIAAQPIISGAGTIAVAVISGILIEKYRRRQKTQADAVNWYENALGLLASVQQTGYRTTTYQHQVDYPKLHEKLEPLAEKIQEHAGSAPYRVDEEARVELIYLAGFCSGLLNLTDNASELTPADFFRNVQQHARQHYTGEHDMEDVNQLFGPFEVDELADDLPDDVEVNEQKLDEFASHFSDESLEAGQPTTIDEALHMPLNDIEDVFEDERAMQELLGDSLANYVRLILVDYTNEIVEQMEERKQALS